MGYIYLYGKKKWRLFLEIYQRYSLIITEKDRENESHRVSTIGHGLSWNEWFSDNFIIYRKKEREIKIFQDYLKYSVNDYGARRMIKVMSTIEVEFYSR